MLGSFAASASAFEPASIVALDDPSGCVVSSELETELGELARDVPFSFAVSVEVLAAPDGWIVDWQVTSEGRRDRYGALTVDAGECGSAAHATFIAVREAVEGEWRVAAGLATWLSVGGHAGLAPHPTPGVSLGLARGWAWDRAAVVAGLDAGWASPLHLEADASQAVYRMGVVGGVGLAAGEGSVLPTLEVAAGLVHSCVRDPVDVQCAIFPRADPSVGVRVLRPLFVVGSRLTAPVPRLGATVGSDGTTWSLAAPQTVEAALRWSLELGVVLSGRTGTLPGLGRE